MVIGNDQPRSAIDGVGGGTTEELHRTPAAAHDPSRLVGRVVDATIDGLRRSCRVIAVGTGGVQLLDEHTRRSVLVPPDEVAALELAPAIS